MWCHHLLTTALLMNCMAFSMAFVEPESDGRSYFAVIISSILELHMKEQPKESGFIISPAAVQKTLAILYNSVDDNDVDLLDAILIEMGLKYFDAIRLMETALEELTPFDTLKEDRYEKLDHPIKRSAVMDYFKNDFNELGTEISYSTTITAPKDLEPSRDFCKFVKEFFNTSILQANDQHVSDLHRNYGLDTAKIPTNCLNLYNNIFYTSKWISSFVDAGDHLTTRGHFRYAEIINPEDRRSSVRLVELPVQAKVPLSMILIMPKDGNDLTWSTSYEVIRPLTDPTRISKILKPGSIEIKIPKTFSFETKANLIESLSKKSVTQANIYGAQQKFKRLFNATNALKNGISVGGLWQNVGLQVEASVNVDKIPVHNDGFLNAIKEKIIDLTQTESFDMTQRPFLFILKSDDVIYFMGYSLNNKSNH